MSDETEEVTPAEVAAGWWGDAKARFIAREFPQYGSREWRELSPDDPRRLAAALDAAECWRKYGPDIIEDLNDALRARPPLSSGCSLAERDARAKPQPAHQLQATPGWPPIAVPGKPGHYLTYTDDRRAAA